MAYIRQSLHEPHGLPPAGLRIRAARDANVDAEAVGGHDYRLLHCDLWGQGADAESTGVQAQWAIHGPQLLPDEHQRHLISAVC